MRNFVQIVFVLSALGLWTGLAEAETKTFENPMIGTNRLDWCVDWGKGCGQEAATAWCKSNAYDHSVAGKQAPDIGASSPTKLIATGEICDQSYCDGFTSITCVTADLPAVAQPAAPETPAPDAEAPAPATVPVTAESKSELFKNPMHEQVRLNWCFSGDGGCGKKAAEAWCAQQGFSSAKDFKYVSGIKPTIQIGTGKTNKKASKAFSRVTCLN
ncbi:MAG: hypothetical protein IT541_02010 [Hyphomicrobiales bacterium]|jgi:hypothetical protein|nr:hypothetical protein [Hyphomicrobiales bacterium]HQX84140.1 hypothetical protein [Aestuariivirga sp.]